MQCVSWKYGRSSEVYESVFPIFLSFQDFLIVILYISCIPFFLSKMCNINKMPNHILSDM